MRLVAGKLGGRKLATPQTLDIRPTSDRVRQSLFNILAHSALDGMAGFELDGARVLDLFAGTGALGLEAISRGAAFCIFVDQGPQARAVIRENIETFELSGVTRLFRRDATNLGRAHPRDVANLIFLDPPYDKNLITPALTSAVTGGWFAANAIIVIEEPADAETTFAPDFTVLDRRMYGSTQITILRHQ